MSLPRFRLRTLMIAVAVLGVIFWTTLWLGKRVRGYRWMAEYHDSRRWKTPIARPPGATDQGITAGGLVTSVERERWHAAMAAKYWRAARYPWINVEPDPPEPR
jgi:hypothetical protein